MGLNTEFNRELFGYIKNKSSGKLPEMLTKEIDNTDNDPDMLLIASSGNNPFEYFEKVYADEKMYADEPAYIDTEEAGDDLFSSDDNSDSADEVSKNDFNAEFENIFGGGNVDNQDENKADEEEKQTETYDESVEAGV